MMVFTVHEPAGASVRGLAEADRVVFVKDGFCWPALFVPILWLIYRRLWLPLVAYIVLVAALNLVGERMNATLAAAAGLAFAVLFAFLANDLRRWQLARRGYVLRAVASGRDIEECELKFFSAWLKDQPAKRRRAPDGAAPPAQPPPGGDVLGVFPRPERA